MKVNIGPYKSWFGPYQIAEKILFWKDKDDDVVYELGEKLNNIKWLYKLCNWVGSKKKRTVKVHIDHYDTWSLDHTLALVILHALKKFKEDNTGFPCGIRPDPNGETETGKPCGNCGCEKEWDIILDKMIWSFEQIANDEAEYHNPDEYKRYIQRVQEGTELFGKYFQTLWT